MQPIPFSRARLSLGVLAAMCAFGAGAPAYAEGSAALDGLSDAAKRELRDEIKREVMAEMKAQMTEEIKRQILAELTASGVTLPAGTSAPADASGKGRVVRVQYVPESTKREIREQLKQDVMAQAKEEHWASPGAVPEWAERFTFEGDMRLRSDSFFLGKNNTPAGVAGNCTNCSGVGLTRGADLVGSNGNITGVPNVNTEDDFNRTRLRLRLGATVKMSDTAFAGLQLSTGGTSGPTSTNQTMGQGFNKYQLLVDRAYITLKPTDWLTLTGGRIANPFLSTDLVWAEDLNFEGVAATLSKALSPQVTAFATGGWFPLRTDNPLQTTSREIIAGQAGFKWKLSSSADFRMAAALYDYHGLEGSLETNARYGPPSASDYGTLYEYPATMRQRGNTLFILNAPNDPANTTYWGLASGFREFDVTGVLDLARFDPVHVVLTGDYVKNLAFDRSQMSARTGSTILDGKDSGYLGKITVGYPTISQFGQWDVSFAYRWLGSDAVLDAFTNSDFGMGGTNNKGYILGGRYGIDKNTWLSLRWMSSQLIDSMAPQISASTTPSKFAVDLLQVDLNAKF